MRYLIFVLVLMSAFAVGETAAAQKPPVYTGLLNNLAVDGYDTVSFFNGEPVKGSSEFSSRYNGAVWHFVSAENKARFDDNPEGFAPQYGGYCAWAVSNGYLAKGDPRFATIVAGKLYLNFNQDVLDRWKEDIPGHIARANSNWPGVLDQ